MNTRCPGLDRISTLPQNITENILSLMPIRDALRTSILSKQWRYGWRGMPKLVFTDNMVKLPSDHCCEHLKRYKLVSAIFHVLMLHNGPTILLFNCSVGKLGMVPEFEQILSYISRGNTVKELIFFNDNIFYQLPSSFFTLQGLERLHLESCVFESPLTFNGFTVLKWMAFRCVKVSAQMLQRFLSKCPLLECIGLIADEESIYLEAGSNNFTFVDLFRCAPLIQTLDISKGYTKHLCAGGMPHKLPTSLALKHLFLDVCFMEQNEISSALCMIRSSPMLQKIVILLYDDEKLPVQQTSTNFLDPEDYSDLNLDHLETLKMQEFRNLTLEMEFVKLIMAKSPVLEKVRIELNDDVSVNEELKMYKDLVLLPFPRASPSTKLIIERRQASI